MENHLELDYLLAQELAASVPSWTSQEKMSRADIVINPEEATSRLNGIFPGQRKRKRTLYSKWQQLELERVFAVLPYPDISTREQLARIIHLPESKVQVWFQNRRARKNKTGKAERSLYRRGSSLCLPPLHLHCQSSSQAYPLNTMQHPPIKPVQRRSDEQKVVSIQQSLNNPYPEWSSSHAQQYLDDKLQYTHGKQYFQWEGFTGNNSGSGYEPTLYDTSFIELEKYMGCTQMSYLEIFPQTINESRSQTSLGYISDLIYNAAILTNVDEF